MSATLNRMAAFVATFSYMVCGLSPVWADDTEIYFGNAKTVGSSNVLFVLDTSGSMAGDDDNNGTSRMDDMKAAFREVISSVDNVNVGLMRFSSPGGPVMFPVRPVNQALTAAEIPSVVSQAITPAVASDGFQFTSGYGINKVYLTTNYLPMGADISYQASATPKTFNATLSTTSSSTSSDVAEAIISSGTTTVGSADFYIPTRRVDGLDKEVFGLRFSVGPTVLPARAGITSATLSVIARAAGTSTPFPVPLKIVGERVDGGSFLTTTAGSPLARYNAAVAASTPVILDWSLSALTASGVGSTASVDVRQIAQDMVNGGGWESSSKAMTLLFRRDPAASDSPITKAQQRVRSFDGTASNRPKLNITWTDPVDTGAVYTALRFDNVKIPRGATVTASSIKFTADASDTTPTNLRIYAEASGAPTALAVTAGNLNASARTRTSAPVSWTAVPAWTAGEQYDSPDIHSVVQEVVNRSDWCGGNSITILVEADVGRRIAKAAEQGISTAPELTVQWSPSSVPKGSSCQNVTASRQIVNSTDDAEDRESNMSIAGDPLDLVGESNYAQQVGLRFTNVQIPKNATITSAYLQFTAKNGDSSAVSLTINGEASDNPSTFTSKNDNVNNRTPTSASISWPSVSTWVAESQYLSPSIASIVQELVNRGGWKQGNSMAFVIKGTSATTRRRAYSFDGSPAKAPRLIINFQDNGTYSESRLVRDELIDVVDGFKANGNTPSQDTLYEAALYYMGRGVDYGKKRGSGPFAYTRVSHPDSYTGGSVVTPTGCTAANPYAAACATEEIVGSPVYKSPITASCQNNYIVFLTDGEPNGAQSTTKIKTLLTELTGSNTCADTGDKACVAEMLKALREKDISSAFADDQHIYTSAIGLYEGGGAWLNKLATNGGGAYAVATDTTSIVKGFQAALLGVSSTSPTFVAAGTSVNAFNRTLNRDELYFAMFKPEQTPRWSGNIKKYKLGAAPSLDIVGEDGKAAVLNGEFKPDAKSFWGSVTDGANVALGGAAGQIKNHATRKMYTYLPGAALPSKTLSAAVNNVDVANANLTGSMFGSGVSTTLAREKIIRWTRGEDVTEDAGVLTSAGTRFVFADPLHSRPVTVTYGGTEAAPDVTVFASTNSGFLHAINNDSGNELFTFIPQELLPLQKVLMDNVIGTKHPYGLDGSITTMVIDPDGDGKVLEADGATVQSGNRVLLFVGMRRGGRNYYALDVTDRSSPKIQWVIKGGSTTGFTGLGQTWSQPVRAQINVGGTKKSVLIFGGGYDEAEDQDKSATRHKDAMGNSIFIVDALDGSLIWSGGPNTTDFVTELTAMNYGIPATISGADINGDGLMDFFFVGDMGGQVWRFDVHNGGTGSSLVSGGVIADLAADASPKDTRRFYHSPALFLGKNGSTAYLGVAIGSGWRAHPLDDQVDDRFYMIRQTNIFSPPSSYTTLHESDLYDATANTIGEGDAAQVTAATSALAGAGGWLIKLPNQGEKVLSSPLIAAGNVYFNTYEPNASALAAESCKPTVGTNRSYIMSVFDATPTVELNGAEGLTSADRSEEVLNPGIISEQPVINRESDTNDIERIRCEGPKCSKLPDGITKDIHRIYWYEKK